MNIVGVPGINGLGKTKGCEKAPELVLSGFDYESIDLDSDNLERQQREIYDRAKFCFESETIFVGGDHSISYPLVRAFFDRNKNKKCLIVFDAHADAMPPMREPTHEEWLRAVIEHGIKGEDVFLIGVRVIEPEEMKFLKENNVNLISVDESRNIKEALRKIERVAFGKEVYVSVDLDVLDGEEFDSTGYAVEEGMTLDDLEKLLEGILKERFVGGDIVEFNPALGDAERGLEIAREVLNKFISHSGI